MLVWASGSDKGQEKVNMNKTFYRRHSKLNLILFFSLTWLFCTIISGCENFIFGGNLREELEKDLSVTYSFYEYPQDNSNHIDVKFLIGRDIYCERFPTLEREDEVFVGWEFYKNPETGSLIPPEYLQYDESHNTYRNINSVLINPEPIALSAIWRPKCTVTFVTNCDIELEPAIVAQGERLPGIEIDYRRGSFRLRGWYYDADFTLPFSYESPITEDITLYAKWVEVFTITYYKNDGSDLNMQQEYDRDTVIQLSAPVFGEREDYGFLGWSLTEGENNSLNYYSFDEITITSDLTLYAVWTSDIITITYIDTSSNFATKTTKYGRGAHVSIGRVLNDDENWYTNLGMLWELTGKDIAGYASSPSVGTNEYGDLMVDYDQWGSYHEGTGPNQVWKNYITVTTDLTLYVIWQDIRFKVYFNYQNPNFPNSGYYGVAVSNENPTNRITVGWNQKLTRPTAVPPVIPGYEFDNWYYGTWMGGQLMITSTPFDFNNTVFNDDTFDGRREIYLYAKFNSSPSGAIGGTVSFDPSSTSGSDIDVTVNGPSGSNATFTLTVNATYNTYEWKHNNVVQPTLTTRVVQMDTITWAIGRHDIDLTVTDYSGNIYSWHGWINKTP